MAYERFVKKIEKFQKDKRVSWSVGCNNSDKYLNCFHEYEYSQTFMRSFDENWQDVCESYDDDGEYPKELNNLKLFLKHNYPHIDYDDVMKSISNTAIEDAEWNPYTDGTYRILFVKYEDLYKYILDNQGCS